MREILFRGKRVSNGEWVYGNYAFTDINDEQHFVFQNEAFVNKVIPETVGQYTGLTDKNGKKIFEGDIVNIELMHPKGFANYEIGCIKYNDAKARFMFCTNEGNYNYDDTDRFEIIGNIHENPEPLGGNYCG